MRGSGVSFSLASAIDLAMAARCSLNSADRVSSWSSETSRVSANFLARYFWTSVRCSEDVVASV